MSDLTVFLLARIAEDEAAAKAATPGPWYWDGPSSDPWPHGDESLRSAGRKMTDTSGKELEWDVSVLQGWGYDASGIDGEQADRDHIARHDPARVLAECEAKRRIVQEADWLIVSSGLEAGAASGWRTLRSLATVYADHPDYREAAR